MEEGTGIIRGNSKNVEATLLLAGNAGTDKEEQRKYQENLLRIYGVDTEIWVQQELFNEENYLSEGSEAKVYYSPNAGFVRKVVDYKRFSRTPFEFMINRIGLHNYLFASSPYELIGFTRTEDFMGNKTFAFIIEQPFIKGKYLETKEDNKLFLKEMATRGNEIKFENNKRVFYNDDYIIKDLHHENVIFTNEGMFKFIDPVPSLNPAFRSFGSEGVRFLK